MELGLFENCSVLILRMGVGSRSLLWSLIPLAPESAVVAVFVLFCGLAFSVSALCLVQVLFLAGGC
jgi:hypothetical protein